MQARWNVLGMLFVLAAFPLLALTGCGGGEGEAVTTNIPADNGQTPAGTAASGDVAPGIGRPVPPRATPPPKVVIITSMGEITVHLNHEKAPVTVDNFLSNYVRRQHYDQTIFHYIEDGSMVLGGGFGVDKKLKSTRAEIINEATNGLSNRRGTVAMARVADLAHSANCQFFFNLADNNWLDNSGRESAQEYGYCVFGEVVDGMDVVDRIAKVKVAKTQLSEMMPVQPIVIESIREID